MKYFTIYYILGLAPHFYIHTLQALHGAFCLSKEDTDFQKAHEKSLNILNCQINTNQNSKQVITLHWTE